MKTSLPEYELKRLVAGHTESLAIDPESVLILPGQPEWIATLRHEGPRIDEAHLAAVREAGRRLAVEYDLAG